MLAAVNARNPLNVKSGSRRGSASISTSIAAKLAATNATAAAAPSVNDSRKGKITSSSSSNGGTAPIPSSGNGGTTSENKQGSSVKDADKDKDTEPLKAFHSLMGLSASEARDLYTKGEAEGGPAGGTGALQKELARRKGAYMRLLLTVAPCLGMTHANPGLQHEVSDRVCKGVLRTGKAGGGWGKGGVIIGGGISFFCLFGICCPELEVY